MEPKKFKKQKRIPLIGSKLDEFLLNLKDKVFLRHSKTKLSVFYRCRHCRTAKICYDIAKESYFITRAHTMNCKFRRNKIKTITKGIEAKSQIVNSEFEHNFYHEQIKMRNSNLIKDLNGEFEVPEFSENIINTSKNNVYTFKVSKMSNQDIKVFQDSFDSVIKSRELKFYDDLYFPKGKFNIPDTYLEGIQSFQRITRKYFGNLR